MSPKDLIDLCHDDKFGELSDKKLQNEKRKSFTRQESEENRSPNACITGCSNSSVLDQCGSPLDESSHQSGPSLCPAPICRQFWKAGNYEIVQRERYKTANQSNKLSIVYHKENSFCSSVFPLCF